MRARRVGELSPPPRHWEGLSDEAVGTDGPLRFLAHRDRHGDVDGIANFRLPWSATRDRAGTLVVQALEATNPVAYRALWGLLIDFDDSVAEFVSRRVGSVMNQVWTLHEGVT
ncbi:hypothetical protein [Streptomyces sp. NPDC006996]|uniref:hypothetical protein n=1 Tax=Streptomyces sp. NPDC006996 TaxID=3156908 RepID=UPI0033FE9942